jgi:uncharacterized membrane protein
MGNRNHLASLRIKPYNEDDMSFISAWSGKSLMVKIILLVAVCLLLGIWLTNTPPGLLGKADAVGYAVCHRISERSFFIGDRQMPLCARCTGMYIGAMIGLLYQLRLGRRGGMPSLNILIVLAIFIIAFAVDGVNSYLHFFPMVPSLYTPQNFLRLLTGIGMGIAIAAMLYPVFQQTIWVEWSKQPALASLSQMGVILAIAGIVDLGILAEIPLVVFPVAILSTLTVLVILGMVYTMVWVMVLKRENAFQNWRSLWAFLVAGFGTTILQIMIMDLIRFGISGSWNGFVFPS